MPFLILSGPLPLNDMLNIVGSIPLASRHVKVTRVFKGTRSLGSLSKIIFGASVGNEKKTK